MASSTWPIPPGDHCQLPAGHPGWAAGRPPSEGTQPGAPGSLPGCPGNYLAGYTAVNTDQAINHSRDTAILRPGGY